MWKKFEKISTIIRHPCEIHWKLSASNGSLSLIYKRFAKYAWKTWKKCLWIKFVWCWTIKSECLPMWWLMVLKMKIEPTNTTIALIFHVCIFLCDIFRWTYQNNGVLFARNASVTNCTKWHSIKNQRNVRQHRDVVVTIVNSKVLAVNQNPFSERR